MKKVLALLLCVVLLLSLAACGNSTPSTTAAPTTTKAPETQAPETKAPETQAPETTPAAPAEVERPAPAKLELPINIAFIPNVMNTHYDMVLSGLKETIEQYGGEKFAHLNVFAPSSNLTSYEEQLVIFEGLLAQDDVDVVIVSTEQEEAEMPYMRRFCEKGVFVFYDNMTELKPENKYYVSSVTYDQAEAGYLIGEWAKTYFKPDEKVNCIVLEGTPGDMNDARFGGFKDAIKDDSRFTIVAHQTAHWMRSEGQSVTENLLTAFPETNFIFGLYDEMSLGALAACKQAGRDDIVVAGFDNTRDANDSIQAGEMTATVDTCAKQQGLNLVHAIVDYCVRGKEVDRVINSKLVVYDVNTIKDFDTENYIYVPREQIYELP